VLNFDATSQLALALLFTASAD